MLNILCSQNYFQDLLHPKMQQSILREYNHWNNLVVMRPCNTVHSTSQFKENPVTILSIHQNITLLLAICTMVGSVLLASAISRFGQRLPNCEAWFITLMFHLLQSPRALHHHNNACIDYENRFNEAPDVLFLCSCCFQGPFGSLSL